jgi:hypothetical protein
MDEFNHKALHKHRGNKRAAHRPLQYDFHDKFKNRPVGKSALGLNSEPAARIHGGSGFLGWTSFFLLAPKLLFLLFLLIQFLLAFFVFVIYFSQGGILFVRNLK